MSGSTLTASTVETANTLSAFYLSVFTRDSTTVCARSTNVSPPRDAGFISMESITLKLSKLDPNKSPGLDGIHPRLLKSCAFELAPFLNELFQHSWLSESLPSQWKSAVISPIYKGGDRLQHQNYRPIALLPTISKVMESLVDDMIRSQLSEQTFYIPLNTASGGACRVLRT